MLVEVLSQYWFVSLPSDIDIILIFDMKCVTIDLRSFITSVA